MHLPTVRVKVKPCHGNEAGIVVMNEADYDPSKHELYDPAKEAALKAEAEAKKAEEEKAEKERLEKEQAEKEKVQKDEKADEPKRGKK